MSQPDAVLTISLKLEGRPDPDERRDQKRGEAEHGANSND
jgi:hypothetical protein